MFTKNAELHQGHRYIVGGGNMGYQITARSWGATVGGAPQSLSIGKMKALGRLQGAPPETTADPVEGTKST